jgi:arginyl-tRNA synthetase
MAVSRNILDTQFIENYTARVEYPPGTDKGHYSTPVAMECAKKFKSNPREIAIEIVQKIKEDQKANEYFEKIEIANQGFINFYISTNAHLLMLQKFNQDSKSIFNLVKTKNTDKKIIFEFVSANPTGPLNIVSARAAAVGDAICRIIKICNYNIHREYYVNDYGNQVRLLGLSLAARYLQKLGHNVDLPEEGYQGEYIKKILDEILIDHPIGDDYDREYISYFLTENLMPKPIDQFKGKHIRPIKVQIEEIFQKNLEVKSVEKMNFDLTNPKHNDVFEQLGSLFGVLAVIRLKFTHKDDLSSFHVEFDKFFSESSLHIKDENGKSAVDKVKEELIKSGHTKLEDGAVLFKSTDFGDDKDRVIVRSDSRPTYLLADIAYHKNKIDRGFTHIYDIWGPDHHGYIARLKGALKALGFPDEKKDEAFEVMIVQQVNMIEDGKPVVMSKRLGKFHTMTDLLAKIPADVVRYFFLMRSQSSHLDFDLDLAMTHSSKNPVYYIQYAHARICSIFREAKKDIDGEISVSNAMSGVTSQQIKMAAREELLLMLWRFPEFIEQISINFEVQLLSEYLYSVATVFTRFYHEKENRILTLLESNPAEADFLLKICQVTRQVIQEGLGLLGISAPDKMDGLIKQPENEE